MNMNKLKWKMEEKGMSIGDVSESIGISKLALYRKLNSFEKITIGEAERLKWTLELTDLEALEIFLY